MLGSHNNPNWQRFAWQEIDPNPGEQQYVWTGIMCKGGQVNTGSDKVFKFGKINFGSISDGSSNTVLYAEKACPSNAYTIDGSGGWEHWELLGYYTGADWPLMRQFGVLGADGTSGGDVAEIGVWSDNAERPDYIPRNDVGHTEEQGFGSAHPGTFSSVFGDGSTHSISNTTGRRRRIRWLAQRQLVLVPVVFH